MMINNKSLKPYMVSPIIALLVGLISALITKSGMESFKSLNQPTLAPPSLVFTIVWTILYILMGISSAIIYQSHSESRRKSLNLYIVQLGFNFLWSIFFFSLQLYVFSLIWLIILLVLVIIMTVYFFKISKAAGLLQIPYILWLCVAAYLNYMIIVLN